MDLYRFVIPLGIATYVFIVLTVLSGARILKLGFRWHRTIGMLALLTATIHAAIVIYYQVL
jgi:hypothetical protein